MVLHHSGFPIRRSPDQCLFTAPRGLSQLVTSFFGSWCQGIHLMLFFAWTSLIDLSINHALSFIANNFFYGCVFTIFRLISKICSFLLHHIRKDLLIFIIHFIPRNKTWSFLIICSFLFLFIRFSMNCFTATFAWWRRSGSNRLPLECHSSALPGELRPH